MSKEKLPEFVTEDENNISLSFDFSDVEEPHVITSDEAEQIEIIAASVGTKESTGNSYYALTFESVSDPFAKVFKHWIMLPKEGLDAKEANNRKLRLREFYEAIGFDYTREHSASDLIGLTCWALLRVEDDPTYGEQNKVRRFVTSN